jgi:hypothetical protein
MLSLNILEHKTTTCFDPKRPPSGVWVPLTRGGGVDTTSVPINSLFHIGDSFCIEVVNIMTFITYRKELDLSFPALCKNMTLCLCNKPSNNDTASEDGIKGRNM